MVVGIWSFVQLGRGLLFPLPKRLIKEWNVNRKASARNEYKSHNSAMLVNRRYFTMNAVCSSAQFGSQMQKINGLDSIVLWFLDAKIEHRKKNVILHKSAIRAESSCFSL